MNHRLKIFLLVLITLTVLCYEAVSQEKYNYQILLNHDNDYFAVQTKSDRYYTYGLQGTFQRIAGENNLGYNLVKKVFPKAMKPIESYGLAIKAFTPSNFDSTDVRFEFDRPFAGLLYGDYGMNVALPHSNLTFNLQAGIMGPSANAGQFQNWFHEQVGDEQVPGWSNQIGDQLAAQLVVNWRATLISTQWAALMSESNLNLGPIFVDATQRARLILGKANCVNSTALYNNELRSTKKIEVFFTMSGGVTLVGYDATIRGGIFDDQFANREVDRAVGVYSASFHIAIKALTASLEMIQNTGRLSHGFEHRYGRANLTIRF